MNKKGDVSDSIILIILLFFLSISFIVVALVNDKFIDVIQNTPLNDSSAADEIIGGLENISGSAIQNGFTFIFAFLIIGMMLSAFLVRVHPAWFFLYIIFSGIAIILAVLIGNTYNTFVSTPALEDIGIEQSKITWIMTHIVQIVLGAAAISVLILFAKPPEQSGGFT